MRARMKRRQLVRRLTILITFLVIIASIGVGAYLLSQVGSSSIDSYINVAVSSPNLAALQAASAQPYGPAPTATMRNAVQVYGGTAFVTDGKPTVVFVGGEFCQYCAVERWALIVALNRFGNLTGLHYMTSAADEGDYATFSFVGSSYSSNFISFRPFEAADRSQAALQTVPSNYTTVWDNYGGGYPFMDFGNTYVLSASIIADPSIITGMNWTSIISNIQSGGSAGQVILQAANTISAVICKITNNEPGSVCTANPIGSTSSLISAPAQGSLTFSDSPAQAVPAQTSASPKSLQRFS